MKEQFKCFIFDLDGTLIDSVDDLTTAFNYMRSKFNYPPVDRAKMETLIGNGMRDVIVKNFAEMDPAATEKDIDTALDLMRNYYLEHTVVLTKVYENVAETLKYLRQKGCKTAVVTNKYTTAAVDILEKLDLAGHLDLIFGNGEGFPLKPAPDLLWEAAKRLGFEMKDCVMVGDNYTDLGAGRNAGCKSIFCNYGYGVELNEKADFYIDNFSELKVYAQ